MFLLAAVLALASVSRAEMDEALSGDDLAKFLHFPSHVKDGTPNQILTEWVKDVSYVFCFDFRSPCVDCCLQLGPYLETVVPEADRATDPNTQYWAWCVIVL